jgi:hypothetical protein
MHPLSTSIYTFSELMAGGYLYVDKTAGIYQLIREYKSQYFLSRQRRFGKSLLVSTLKAIFQGRRELFSGLFLATTDYDWPVYPVIHLDLGSSALDTVEELEENLVRAVQQNADTHQCTIVSSRANQAFEDLILALASRQTGDGGPGRVVILIDKYDKPLLGHLGKPSAAAIQEVLKKFYAVVKKTEPLQRFALITGVSKFTKVSIFSDLNNHSWVQIFYAIVGLGMRSECDPANCQISSTVSQRSCIVHSHGWNEAGICRRAELDRAVVGWCASTDGS